MAESYQTLYRVCEGEYIEKKSRFLAELYPVETEEEAFFRLEAVKKKYWDARHHCWAYVIGTGTPCERMSDDGEPSGTAGKPILEVLKGRGLTNVFAVVTRYFGGTLLGTGGLVRAYSQAVADALFGGAVITRVPGVRLRIETDYTVLGKLQYLTAQRGLYTEDVIYTDKVQMQVLVPERELSAFRKEVTEGTSGQAVLDDGETCWFAQTEDGYEVRKR